MTFGRISLGLCLVAAVACGSNSSAAKPVSPRTTDRTSPTTTPDAEPASPSTTTVVQSASPVPSDSPPTAYVAQGARLIAVDVRTGRAQTKLADFGPRASLDWVTYDPPRRRVFLGVSSGCDPGVNGIWVVGTDGHGLRKVARSGGRASVSPDGTRLAYPVSGDGCGVQWLFVRDLATGKEQRFERPGGAAFIDGVAWIDDRYVYFSSLDIARTLDTTNLSSPLVPGESPKRGRVVEAIQGGYAAQHGCVLNAPLGCKATLSVSFTSGGPGYQYGPIANPLGWSVDATGAHALVLVDEPTGVGANTRSVVWIVDRAGGRWRLVEGQAADW
jgi:hypothetical protein